MPARATGRQACKNHANRSRTRPTWRCASTTCPASRSGRVHPSRPAEQRRRPGLGRRHGTRQRMAACRPPRHRRGVLRGQRRGDRRRSTPSRRYLRLLRQRQQPPSAHRDRRAPVRFQPRRPHGLTVTAPPPGTPTMSSTSTLTVAAVPTERSWLLPLELGLLGAIWGASFLFMRIAATDFGSFALVEIRLALGALILLPFLWRERVDPGADAVAEAAGDRRDQFGGAVPAVRLGRAACAGRRGRHHQCDDGAVHRAGRHAVLRREDRRAARVGAAGRFRRRGGAGQRQDRRRQHRLGGGRRLHRGVPVRRRRAPGASPFHRPAAGRGGSGDAGHFGVAGAAVRDRAMAAATRSRRSRGARRRCWACSAPAWRTRCTTG